MLSPYAAAALAGPEAPDDNNDHRPSDHQLVNSETSRLFRDELLERHNKRASCFGARILGVVTTPHVSDEFCVAAQVATCRRFELKMNAK